MKHPLTILAPRHVVAATLALSCAACTPAAQPGARFTPLAARTSDAVITKDLARFDSAASALAPRASDAPAARLARARAASYVSLARDAYERNDDGTLTALLLAQSQAPAAGALAHARRPDLWALLDSAAAVPSIAAQHAPQLVALETALLRAQYEVLGAPRCNEWEATAVTLAADIRRIPPPPPPAPAPAPAPPTPAPAPAAAPAPRVAPKELHGVPSRVHFALDKSELAPASRRVLDALLDSLTAFPTVRVVLEGNTDQRGSVEYNAALSRRRALSVQGYLVSKGLDAGRISIKALGKSQLETTEMEVTSLARNRRVLVRYFAPDGREIPAVSQLDDLQVEKKRK